MAKLALWGVVGLLFVWPATARGGAPLGGSDFTSAAPQGFGDRQNSWAWSMQWWKGHLYVGTNRAWHCAETAALYNVLPRLVPYPPTDPDVGCTPDPEDLPLRAEIWRWTPDTNTWERVYRSPNDVLLTSHKMTARDIGYRGMIVYQEADGTEALYVSSVSPQFIGFDRSGDKLPPRILRSTDGVNFQPVPQDPGTALGNFPFSILRNPVTYNGRIYIVGGSVQGSGALLESDDHPELGNDHWRVVSPPGMVVSAVGVYNGHLYVGIRSVVNGYAIAWTDPTGSPPYTFRTVIADGGYLQKGANTEILSFQEFNGLLYAGGNGIATGSFGPGNAAELVRIHPDNTTWDLVVGYPRNTPQGYKRPASGQMAGFGSFFNAHMWRMAVFDGNLYVGTFDTSTTFRNDPFPGRFVQDILGFDLYRTADGDHFDPVTTTGFGDKFNFGARTMAATPYGLFIGTANYYYGLQIWRGAPAANVPLADVSLSGPTQGAPTAPYAFTAAVSPITATTPITYVWQATGQADVTHLDGVNNTVTFAWNTLGNQVITLTATNALGTVMDTHTITIQMTKLYLPSIQR